MNENNVGIKFGTGPVGYQADRDEKIREVVDKINKETEAAGLPWWAGMFNPDIVKLANIEQGQCNCAKDEPERTKCGETARKPEETMAERQIREMEEQEERLRRADEAVVKAIESAGETIKWARSSIEEEEMSFNEQVAMMEWMAKLAETVAKMKQSLNGMPFYGYGA